MEQAFARAKVETTVAASESLPGDGRQAMMGFAQEDELMRRDTENRDFLNVW